MDNKKTNKKQRGTIKLIIEGYRRAKNFVISEGKIILWSKHNILHGNLDSVRNPADPYIDMMLKESDFEIRIEQSVAEKKAQQLMKRQKRKMQQDNT